jgi:hypothetical protein
VLTFSDVTVLFNCCENNSWQVHPTEKLTFLLTHRLNLLLRHVRKFGWRLLLLPAVKYHRAGAEIVYLLDNRRSAALRNTLCGNLEEFIL